jgi:hypothetical protein
MLYTESTMCYPNVLENKSKCECQTAADCPSLDYLPPSPGSGNHHHQTQVFCTYVAIQSVGNCLGPGPFHSDKVQVCGMPYWTRPLLNIPPVDNHYRGGQDDYFSFGMYCNRVWHPAEWEHFIKLWHIPLFPNSVNKSSLPPNWSCTVCVSYTLL